MTFVKHTGLIVCFSKLSQNIEQATIKTYCWESLAQRFLHGTEISPCCGGTFNSGLHWQRLRLDNMRSETITAYCPPEAGCSKHYKHNPRCISRGATDQSQNLLVK